MRFFWKKTEACEAADSSWTLPFSDMMSLLLAVFVMIAAMGELRRDGRFSVVGAAVRSSFGFAAQGRPPMRAASPARPTLIERLRQAGLVDPGDELVPQAADAEVAEICEVTTGMDRVAIRLTGAAAFGGSGAQLRPEARKAVARIGAFLADGEGRIEVRGYVADGLLPRQSAFRDGLDLSYARARAAADLLVASGVSSSRVSVSACGGQEPPAAAADLAAAVDRGLEIIVHAGHPAAHVSTLAEKERSENG